MEFVFDLPNFFIIEPFGGEKNTSFHYTNLIPKRKINKINLLLIKRHFFFFFNWTVTLKNSENDKSVHPGFCPWPGIWYISLSWHPIAHPLHDGMWLIWIRSPIYFSDWSPYSNCFLLPSFLPLLSSLIDSWHSQVINCWYLDERWAPTDPYKICSNNAGRIQFLHRIISKRFGTIQVTWLHETESSLTHVSVSFQEWAQTIFNVSIQIGGRFSYHFSRQPLQPPYGSCPVCLIGSVSPSHSWPILCTFPQTLITLQSFLFLTWKTIFLEAPWTCIKSS